MTLVEKLFSYNGRLRRRDYWVFSILMTLVILCIQFAGFTALGVDWMSAAQAPWANRSYMLVTGVVALLAFWPASAILVKRGHDRNRPAAWAIGVQLVSIAISYAPMFGEQFRPLAMGSLLTGLYMFIDFGCLDGTKGPNRYGPSPKGVETPAEVFA